jgi:hypothetical protein
MSDLIKRPGNSSYREALKDDESLATFLKQMQAFDRAFCDHMAAGTDFTLRLEVHGCKGDLIHVRVHSDGFERPRAKVARGLRS